MNFLHLNYLPGILLAFVAFVFIVFVLERRFFALVQRYWFYRRSFFSYVSSALFLAGTGGLLMSLLDARGREERIKTPVPKERTLILIDTSASMLAEDVKPSRLQKAALLAKHFARKAAGHQIAVVAFSEITKKIVPFTTDQDLIDARLDSIKNLRNQYASSAVTSAIQESIQYLKEGEEGAGGNILVLTDGEETAPEMDLRIPENIRVALVGIGTTQGGRIPMDDARGFRFGYKKDRGVDVITKLNENFFKATAADIPSAKYWMANSYNLPSEEIVDFFKRELQKGLEQQDMVIRPVMMQWLVIPALLAFIFSYCFKAIRIFTAAIALFMLIPAYGAELSAELSQRIQELSRGELNKLERLKLAGDLYKAGSKEEALALYEENLELPRVDQEIPPEAYLNYGTALLESDQEQKGLEVYQSLSDSLKDPAKARELTETMEKNVVTHFKVKEQKKKQQQKKDQQKKQDQDKKQSGEGGQDQQPQEGQGQPQEKGQQGKQQDPQDSPEKGQDKKQEKKDSDDPEINEDEKDKGKGDEKKDQQQPEASEPKESQIRARKKVDPKLQQLMDDDRQLQMKMMENGTRDLNKRRSRKSKDW